MRAFLELLPYRLEQALAWRALRVGRARRARGLSSSFESPAGERRLFIDLSVISTDDAGTGIQRVVRALSLSLLDEAPAGWEIRFVSARRRQRYQDIAWPDGSVRINAQEMRARPGDVFLGLDYALDAVRRQRRQLSQFRHDGGALWFLVHDLLPLHHPKWFSGKTVIRYRAWLGILAGLADGFLCNSSQTEEELRRALADDHGISHGYRTKVLPMGHAILDAPRGAREPVVPRFDTATPFALMVGTLEPRKGHGDVIGAFEELWRRGYSDRLVFVGRLGWGVDTLHRRILDHSEYGARLLWFDDVEDAELFGIYEACAGVIVASHGEGFGLPLIEALGHGKPVLARDLPVFRVHADKGVRYFPPSASAEELATAVRRWLDDAGKGMIPVACPTADWGDSARILLAAIEGDG